MKLTVQASDLKYLTGLAARFAASRNLVPVLATFLLTAKQGRLTIAATDLEAGIRASIPAVVEEPGSVCVDTKTLAGWAGKVTDEITLELRGDNLHLRAGRARATLATMPADQFPALPPEPGETYNIPGFLDAVASVAYAVSRNEARPLLRGINIALGDGKLLLTATDGLRVGMADLSVPEAQDKPWRAVTVPAPFFAKVRGDAATLALGEDHFHLLADDAHYVSRLIDGQYPPVRSLLPQPEFAIAVDRDELRRAVERGSLFVREDADGNSAAILRLSESEMVISASAGGAGSAEEVLSIEGGRDLEIGFNPEFLLDAIRAVRTEKVEIGLADRRRPAVIRDGDRTHVILPIVST